MSNETFEHKLRETFESEFDGDGDTAATAAASAAAFRADVDESLTVQDVLDRMERREGEFEHRYDFAIGDLAAANEDCTDSREYRIAGFDDLAADPEQGI